MAAKAQLKADRSGSGSGALTAAAEVVPVVKMNPGVPGAATSPDVWTLCETVYEKSHHSGCFQM